MDPIPRTRGEDNVTATFWLNKYAEEPEKVAARAPHSTLTRHTDDPEVADVAFCDYARHTAWSRGYEVVWQIEGEGTYRQTPIPDRYP